MKRIIVLLTAVIICLSFTACGINDITTENEIKTEKETAELIIDENGYADFTQDQIIQYVEKVELTLDNWNLYFEDYCREKVTETVNSFGEITYNTSHKCDFGLKEDVVASAHNVAFKFTGYELCHGLNAAIPDEKGYYLVDFGNIAYNPDYGRHYTEYECAAVTGEIYIYHLPREVKKFTIDGEPRGDVYAADFWMPYGDMISELYNRHHQ